MIEQPVAEEPQEAPVPVLPWQPGQARPLPPDALAAWQERVATDRRKAKTYHDQWERGLDRYAKAKVAKRRTEINALLDYRHVESKKSVLFHRTPEVNLIPVDPQDMQIPYDQILPLREKVLNYELGPDRANAKRALHKTLIDTLAASGWMIVEVGYEDVKLPTGNPLMPNVPVWSRRFARAISSKRMIVPSDFYDTDFDQSPYLGYDGIVSLAKAKKMGWYLPPEFQGTRASSEARYKHQDQEDGASDPQVHFTKLWYRASEFDETVFNPELFRCLILVEGCDHPAWHVDSPYQMLTPEGALTDDSMVGNPIHMDAIRDLIDSAYVPSDLTVGEQLSEEVNKFRTELMQNRKGRRPVTLVSDGLGQEVIQKIAANSGPVPVSQEYFDGAGNQRAMVIAQAGSEPRDNYTAQEKCEQDWEQALGVSPNQAGNFARTQRTATEVRTVQGNSQARAETDKDRVREFFVGLVRKFDCVIQRTMTPQEVQKILGMTGAMLYEQWKLLPGTYAYKIQPDSGRFIDAKEYRSQKLDEYNLLRKDPLINAAELCRQTIRALAGDPAKLVPQDQAEDKPEPVKLSASMSVDNAMMLPAEMELLFTLLEQANGIVIPPELRSVLMAQSQLRQQLAEMQQQNPEHGGVADKPEPLNKHQQRKTGGVQGVGSAA